MCDPFSMIAMVGSLASAAVNYSQQSSMMSKQAQANAEWVAYQRQKSQEEWQRQEQLRQRAEAARQESLQKLDPEAQKQNLKTEQDRLTKDITPQDLQNIPDSGNMPVAADKLLSGQQKLSEPAAQDLASKVTQASRDARSRIQALAELTSYGGSQFSLQNTANRTFQAAGQNINLAGNERQGSLAAYGAEKQVQPRQIIATPSLLGGLSGSLAQIAGKGAGGAGASISNSLGSMFSSPFGN